MTALPSRVGTGFSLARAALQADLREARLRALARSVQALDLRLARVLAWLRDQPLETLGYPGWQVFCRERVDWGESWVRDMVRLVRSGLVQVIDAACCDEIPLALAVQAPGWCAPDEQESWVKAARDGTLPPRPRLRPRGASATVETGEDDTLLVWHGRRKARLLTGLGLSDREADTRILEWWRDQRTDLVEEALAPAPRPAPATFDLAWTFDDPATALVGPWRAPATLDDALALVDDLQITRRSRGAELGAGYEDVVRRGLHRAWGYRTVEEFCRDALGLSARSLQRYAELARGLRHHPGLAALPLTRAHAIARVARDHDVDRWIDVSGRVGVTELFAAVAHVEAGADPDVLLGAYEAAMAATTTTVALASVARTPVPPTLTDRVHPDLPQACRWLLLEVVLPRQHGFGRVKERDDFICSSPECRRRAARNHAHHRDPRSRGGSDHSDNGECDCPSCHLRLIHPGHIWAERKGDTWVWHYPGRTVTVFPGPVLYAVVSAPWPSSAWEEAPPPRPSG